MRATAHQLRRSAGTSWYRASGRDLLATAALLRHRNVKTTQVYARLHPTRTAAVVDAVDLAGLSDEPTAPTGTSAPDPAPGPQLWTLQPPARRCGWSGTWGEHLTGTARTSAGRPDSPPPQRSAVQVDGGLAIGVVDEERASRRRHGVRLTERYWLHHMAGPAAEEQGAVLGQERAFRDVAALKYRFRDARRKWPYRATRQ